MIIVPCAHHSEEELSARMYDIKWALVDRSVGRFVRYDGWYKERTEIEHDLENNTLPDDIPDLSSYPEWEVSFALGEYERWSDVDWQLVECDLIHPASRPDICYDYGFGKVLTEKQQDDARKAERKRLFLNVGAALLLLIGLPAVALFNMLVGVLK